MSDSGLPAGPAPPGSRPVPRIVRAESLLLLASAIWGFAFVAQRVGMEYVGPFTFNGIRFALGALALVPAAWIVRRRRRRLPTPGLRVGPRRALLYGATLGGVLFVGASLQQVGIVFTTAGKAAFITGLYVVLVPILSLVLGRRVGVSVWVGAVTAVVGLFLLTVTDDFRVFIGDALVLLGALFWAIHVLLIDRLTGRMEPIPIALLQFVACSLLSAVVALAIETTTVAAVRDAAVPILYGGVMSVGVAYTLQVVGQRHAPPAHAAIILSLEAVFGALGGWLLLAEELSTRGLVGCGLMLGGVIVSQLDLKGRKGPPSPVSSAESARDRAVP